MVNLTDLAQLRGSGVILVGIGWLVGLGYALLVGHWLARNAVEVARRSSAGELRTEPPERLHPAMVGYIERLIVFGAWVLGQRELAGGWLVLKAAATWRTWQKERAVYNVFLIGIGMSVIQASVGAFLVPKIHAGDWAQAVLLALGGIAFGALLGAADRGPIRGLFS